MRTLMWLALAGLVARSFVALKEVRGRGHAAVRKLEPLHVWETEGGGVPLPEAPRMAQQVRTDDLLSPGAGRHEAAPSDGAGDRANGATLHP